MTALKTVAMRLRGTDTKTMEEEGLETDGAVESKSKLRSKVKSLSGVDILTNTGAYKSTYQILSEIADVWGDINDMDQAALLELLAGKRSGSVMSAILQNPETLKKAFESATKAEGSALKENEKYLDSIQGKIDLLTNSIQMMWNNALDSDVVKGVVDLGTHLIKIVDTIGLIPSILTAIGLVKFVPWVLKLTMHTDTFGSALLSLLKPLAQIKGSGKTLSQIFAQTAAAAMNASGGVATFDAYLKAAGKTLRAFVNTPLGWFTIAAIAITALVGIVDAVTTSTKEWEEELDNLNSKIDDTKNEIDSLNSELETTRDRMAELLALPSLSLTEQEELKNLQLQNAELERKLELQEALLKSQERERVNTAKEWIGDVWQDGGSDSYTDRKYWVSGNGTIGEDKWWIPGVSAKEALNTSIPKYTKLSSEISNYEDMYIKALKQFNDDGKISDELRKQMVDLAADYGDTRTDDALLSSFDTYIEANRTTLDRMSSGINMVLSDTLDIIQENGLSYSLGDENINAFLDEYYAQFDAWQVAQGVYNKSDVISNMFGATATEEVKELSTKLKEIANDENLSLDQQRDKIENVISSLDKENSAYNALRKTMEVTGVSAENIADYFVGSASINSSTIEGIAAQYEKGIKLLEQFKATNNDANNARMKKLQEGGSVDLFDRPEISSSELVKEGWENAGDGISTVYTNTYSNEDGTVAINFTPILPDGQVLTPEKLQEYAEGVIAGTREDDLNLQIGAKFTGQNAIEEAVRAAEEIHSLQESFYMGGDVIKIEGIEYDLDDFFSQDEEGKFKAKSEEFSKILKGMDEDCRKTFMSLAESVKNGEISWNQAIEKFSIASMQAVIKNMKSEMESLNKQIFKGLDDEISGIIDTFDEFSAALENVASSMDLLHTAQEQMNNSGQISVKTALELIASTDQWNQVLAIENGQIKLVDGAEQVLIQTKLDTIKSNIELALQEVNTSLAMLDAGDAAITLSDKLGNWLMQQIERVKRGLAWLDAAAGALWDNLWNGGNNDVVAAGNDAAAKVTKSRAQEISDLQKQKADLEAQKAILEGIGTVETFEDYYDYDKTPGDKYDDDDDDSDEESKLDKIQKKYERKISNLDNQQQYLENEIDMLEAQHKGVSKSYYEEQIKLEEQKMALLQKQREELTALLNETAKGSDEWWEISQSIWEVEHAIQESTLRTIEFRESIADLYKTAFDELDDAYSGKSDIYSDRQAYIEKYMELFELEDKVVPASAYTSLIAEEEKKMANNVAKLASLQAQLNQAVASGYIEAGDERWRAMQSEIRQTTLDIQDSKVAIAEYKKELKELHVEAFNIVRDAFSNRNDYFENQQNYIEGYIDYLEASGIDATPEIYEKLIEIEKKKRENNVADLVNARAGLRDLEAAGYTAADEEWVDAYNKIVELEKGIQDSDIAIKQWEKDIRDLEFEKFDKFAERVNNFNKELENVRKLIDDEDVAFEDGSWTKEGITNLAMLYHQIENNTNMIAKYNEEMAKLEKQYKSGEVSESEYTERVQNLKDQQWELVLSNEELRDSIMDINEARIDIVEEGINKEVEAYKELIDLKKEELDAERDLYEFRKDVEQQSMDIAELERKISALSGSDDAADIAERRRLEKELRDKNKDLQNTYYDHAKDSQSTALDDEMEAYEKAGENYIESLRDQLENVDLMIQQTLQDVLFNANVTFEELNMLAAENNITLSQNLMTPWQRMSELAIMTKNQIGMELLNLNEDNIAMFSNYAGTLLTSPFEVGGIACNGFKMLASTQIAELQAQVYSASSDLLRDLSFPWIGAEGPINTFSQSTDAALQGAITKAQAAAVEMTTSNEKPWMAGIGAAELWSSSVEAAYDNAIAKAHEYAAAVSDAKAAEDAMADIPNYTTDKPTTGPTGPTKTKDSKKEEKKTEYQATYTSYPMKGINEPMKKTGKDGMIMYSFDSGNMWYKESDIDIVTLEMGGMQYKIKKGAKGYWRKDGRNGRTDAFVEASKYAKGTMGAKSDHWAITDEPQFGDELVLVPTSQGNLSYMRKGTSVVPADITKNLVEWGQLDPNTITSSGVGANINIINSAVNKPEVKLDIENFLRCDNVSRDALPELEKFVNEKMNNLVKQLNYGLKKFK